MSCYRRSQTPVPPQWTPSSVLRKRPPPASSSTLRAPAPAGKHQRVVLQEYSSTSENSNPNSSSSSLSLSNYPNGSSTKLLAEAASAVAVGVPLSSSSPLSTAAAAPPAPVTLNITAREINQRIKMLFGKRGGSATASATTSSGAGSAVDAVVERPCVSARLFACYSLYAEQTAAVLAATPTRRSARQSQNNHGSTATQLPVLPLLRALVHVEVVALGGTTYNNNNSTTHYPVQQQQQQQQSFQKKTHFSGFDCSSTHPPVDRVDGSATHQQDSIDALVKAKDQIQLLHMESFENATPGGYRHAVQHCLVALVAFLRDTMAGESVASVQLRKECAKSVSVSHYPTRRIQKAVTVYLTELEIVLARLQKQQGGGGTPTSAIVTTETTPLPVAVLFVEQRLAEFVGQAVRYNLRRFFNKAPPRLSPADTKYDLRCNGYSQVYALCEMTMSDQAYENAAVDDECISALFSTALCRLFEFFGLEALLDANSTTMQQQQQIDLIPAFFCQAPASNRSLSIRGGGDALLTDQDVHDILDDIDEATGFLAACKACRFLLDLLAVPGVQAEIERQGGWWEVETHASISWKYELWKLCPADAHLVVLCNYTAFIAKMESLLPAMEHAQPNCHAVLACVAKRFHVTTKSKNLLQKYPAIPDIAETLQEGLERAHAFPLIQALQ